MYEILIYDICELLICIERYEYGYMRYIENNTLNKYIYTKNKLVDYNHKNRVIQIQNSLKKIDIYIQYECIINKIK